MDPIRESDGQYMQAGRQAGGEGVSACLSIYVDVCLVWRCVWDLNSRSGMK